MKHNTGFGMILMKKELKLIIITDESILILYKTLRKLYGIVGLWHCHGILLYKPGLSIFKNAEYQAKYFSKIEGSFDTVKNNVYHKIIMNPIFCVSVRKHNDVNIWETYILV